MSKQLPFFVYGTLRPGHHNFKRAFDFIDITTKTVTAKGFQMHLGGGYPYIVRHDTDTVVGTLITVTNPNKYDGVVRTLDMIEGFRDALNASNHYDRIVITVDGVEAYTYVASDRTLPRVIGVLPVMENGDWNDADRKRSIWNADKVETQKELDSEESTLSERDRYAMMWERSIL